MINIYIDIETVPVQREEFKAYIVSSLKAPANYKDPEKIAAYIAENSEKAVHDTGLDGTFGEIICISYAVNEDEPKLIGRTLDESEAGLLRDFFAALKADLAQADPHGSHKLPTWVGHYATGFDLRFIWQRCVINKVKPTVHIPYDAAPWHDTVFDTKVAWSGAKGGSSSKLDELCTVMGYDGKNGMDGSQVWDYIKAGRYKEVFEYCKQDVVKARQLYKRMTFTEV